MLLVPIQKQTRPFLDGHGLFPDDLHQHPLFTAAIKLTIENTLPGAEIQAPLRNGHDHLPAHDLPFHMRIGIVFADIVPILRHRFVGGQFFQPDIIVVVQAGFIVIDEHRGGDVHRVDQHQALFDAAFVDALLNVGCDVDERPAGGDLEPEFFAVAFHRKLPK
ncbi:hypothetical protein DESC_780278 [Desulfosarcina cetonica]|nr:hypothetical protein DESC_780278 [Desulfosarcina cetonica]